LGLVGRQFDTGGAAEGVSGQDLSGMRCLGIAIECDLGQVKAQQRLEKAAGDEGWRLSLP
jgi:hypothetical protein